MVAKLKRAVSSGRVENMEKLLVCTCIGLKGWFTFSGLQL